MPPGAVFVAPQRTDQIIHESNGHRPCAQIAIQYYPPHHHRSIVPTLCIRNLIVDPYTSADCLHIWPKRARKRSTASMWAHPLHRARVHDTHMCALTKLPHIHNVRPHLPRTHKTTPNHGITRPRRVRAHSIRSARTRALEQARAAI